MQKVLAITFIVILLTPFLATPVQAAPQGPQIGTCSPGFELHPFMDHEDHHEHHIGLAQDLNQDGMICVRHLPDGLHVHVDNVLP